MMKFATSLAFTLAATLTAASAFAADKAPANTLTPQQQKMSDCSKDAHAKELKGDDYKTYMSTCMKATGTPAAAGTTATTAAGTTAAATPGTTATTAAGAKPADASKTNNDAFVATGANNPQQQKMKACATDAKTKGLKGADRRTFMSTCLKKDSSATTTPPPPAAK